MNINPKPEKLTYEDIPKYILKDAKKSMKKSIKFLQEIIKDLSGKDVDEVNRGIIASWCIEEYLVKELIDRMDEKVTECKEPIKKNNDNIIKRQIREKDDQ